MRLTGKTVLKEFFDSHADARTWISAWVAEVEDASWETPQDIKDRYRSTSFLPGNTVVLNVKGNHYRLVCKVAYKSQIVTVVWVGTHAEYSKLY